MGEFIGQGGLKPEQSIPPSLDSLVGEALERFRGVYYRVNETEGTYRIYTPWFAAEDTVRSYSLGIDELSIILRSSVVENELLFTHPEISDEIILRHILPIAG